MRRLLGSALATGIVAGFTPAAEIPNPPVGVSTLVEKLGSPAFRDRDTASKQLLTQGDSALALLDLTAATHSDPEVRQRCAEIVERIRQDQENTRLIPRKTVKLSYTNMPLAAVINDLKSKTGVPIVLDPNGVTDTSRTITLQTDELPIWQAIEVFRKAAGLVETFHDELPLSSPQTNSTRTTRFGRRTSYSAPATLVPLTPDTTPIYFRDGVGEAVPGERGTGVRVLALPPSFRGNRIIRGSGQVQLNLDVAPLAGLKWSENVTVRVLKAEDETGRPVTVSHAMTQPANQLNPYAQIQQLGAINGNVIMWDGDVQYGNVAPSAQPNPRVVPVILKTDDRSIRSLKVFEGVVAGEITLTNQTLMNVSNLSKAIGQSQNGPQGVKLTIVDYKKEGMGRTIVKIRTENPNPWTQMRLGRRQLMMMNGLNVEMTGEMAGGASVQYRYTDDKGNVLRPQTRAASSTDDGVRQVSETELIFPMRPDIGDPANLIVTGQKVVPVEIPFKLRDVPLP